MPHQVFKATVKGSKGDLAKITAALKDITGPNGEKVNIQAIGGGESSNVGGVTLGVISMILEPDDPPMEGLILDKLTDLDLGGGRKVEHVDKYPNVHIVLADVPGALNAAVAAVAAANLEIVSVLSLGSSVGIATVGLGFEANDETAARTALGTAPGVVVLP